MYIYIYTLTALGRTTVGEMCHLGGNFHVCFCSPQTPRGVTTNGVESDWGVNPIQINPQIIYIYIYILYIGPMDPMGLPPGPMGPGPMALVEPMGPMGPIVPIY